MKRHVCLLVSICLTVPSTAVAQNEREAKLRADKQRFETLSDWLYNDLDQAYQQARQTGKPIMAVLRCIPCEECVKLDDDVIDDNPAIASLMGKFIRVRLTGTNGLDLRTFQYDTDQSFAIFFLNADKIVYGRFGTRSHRTEWVTDVSVEGMASAMEAALALHQRYPGNRDQLVAKSDRSAEFSTPESFPTLRKKPGQLNWQGRDFAKGVLKDCIHCHEISEARLEVYWQRKEPIPQTLLYPYPHPKSVGLVLDPKHRARVMEVNEDSPAKSSGLMSGDDILRMDGQPLISMADVQWVLHHLSPEGADVALLVRRDDQLVNLVMKLEPGWRRKDDTTWRTGHWILRRSMLGGMKLTQSDSDAADSRALRVFYLGDWGPFGVAKRAGVRKDDVIIAVDGRTDLRRESDVFDYVNENKRAGDQMELEIRRAGKPVTVRYKIQ